MQKAYSNLDIELNINSIKQEYEDKKKEFDLLPMGQYTGTLEKLQPLLSSTGKPMISVEFKVQSEEYKNRHYFYNFMIHNGTGIYFAIKFLKCLNTKIIPITFENYTQFEKLIEEIKNISINNSYMFIVSKTSNNYDKIDII